MTILKGGEVHPISAAPFVGDVAFEDGKITELGQDLRIPGAEVIDVSGKFVMPGLVDPHSHIGLRETGSRETDHNEKGRPVTPEMRAIDSLHPGDPAFSECRKVGITTSVTGPGSINLIGGTFTAIKNTGNSVEDMVFRKEIAMKMALGENPKFNYMNLGKEPYCRMGSAALIRQALTKAKDYGRKKELGAISDTDLGMEALVRVLDGELPMKIHCHRADDIETAIRIMDEFDIRYTLDHCTEGYLIPDTLKRALEKNCNGIIIGPIISFSLKLECSHRLRETFAPTLFEEGIPFAMCTDFYDSMPECLMFAAALGVANGLPEDVALNSITLGAAKAAGIDDRVGSLEPGKDADVAVFNGNPLNCLNLCSRTYIDGKLVYQK